MSYWFALKNWIFWITLNNAEDNALFTRKPNVWVRWESLPFTEAAQKIPDLYYTKWSSSRIKDTTNYITLWCTVHKTYHHISSESPTLTESFHYKKLTLCSYKNQFLQTDIRLCTATFPSCHPMYNPIQHTQLISTLENAHRKWQ